MLGVRPAYGRLLLVSALFTVSRGPADGPLVVLVHGTMDRSTSFARVQRALEDVRTLAYDRRGYARSADAGAAQTVGDHVSDLADLLDGEPAVIAGHSYGGVVALAAAVAHAEVVRGVVAYEPPLAWLPQWPQGSAGEAALTAGGSAEDAAEAFMRRLIGDTAWERLPARTKEERRNEGVAMLSDITSIRPPHFPFDPSDVSVPVTLGRGGDSTERHRVSVELLSELIPQSELHVIAGAGHGGHRSHPGAFADLVRRLL
jgi:pimeloyl-ACP methyl ester carboxylesterase